MTDSQKHNIQEAKLYQGAGEMPQRVRELSKKSQHRVKSQAQLHVLVTPHCREERQADPGSLQTNQPSKNAKC